jgi:Fe-Mn family superoxide dismutase
MITPPAYRAKRFDLGGLKGISDQTLTLHLALYERYVREANRLSECIDQCLKDGRVDQDDRLVFSELTRRLGYEYNGMMLHEYYFGNLKRQADDPEPSSAFIKAAEATFGSYAMWKMDFVGIADMRGVGWAICYQDPINGRLSNHWVSLHHIGTVIGFTPLLVLDLWEHAYLVDVRSERAEYVESFFSNIAWDVVDERLRVGTTFYLEERRREIYGYPD